MNSQSITKQTLAIYLDVAQNALTVDPSVSFTMLGAASEIIADCNYGADQDQIVRCAELLILHQEFDRAEILLNAVIRKNKLKQELTDWGLMRVYDSLAEVFLAQAKPSKAKRKSEQTLKIMAGIVDVDQNLIASRTRRLARIHFQMGEFDKASSVLSSIGSAV